MDRDGTIVRANTKTVREPLVTHEYLKMRIADAPLSNTVLSRTSDGDDGIRTAMALSAYFLASVIRRSQRWILGHETNRTKGREVEWSANVGVPVEYFDSPLIERFRRVLAVAWKIADDRRHPRTLQGLCARFDEYDQRVDLEMTDCHATPEIAAAIHSFIMSRSAVPGVYIYFDVGGGTVDGVGFDYANNTGERRVNFYSGRVRPYGVAAFAQQISAATNKRFRTVEKALLGETRIADLRTPMDPYENKVRRLVGYVVMTAKEKDPRDWRRDVFQRPMEGARLLLPIDDESIQPLPIFVGGGGASSKWYRQTINSMWARAHKNAGIPRYAIMTVPAPSDLEMNGLHDGEFHRFAIAYGLSIPVGEGAEVGLPSEFDKAAPSRRKRPVHGVSYEDSKDAWD